jgi:hypothetical protein
LVGSTGVGHGIDISLTGLLLLENLRVQS